MISASIIQSKTGPKNPVKVVLNIIDRIDTYEIIYKRVKKIEVKYESDEEWEHRGFDDWGYSELLAVDDEILSHEILFASGATILIHFKNKNIMINKLCKAENK